MRNFLITSSVCIALLYSIMTPLSILFGGLQTVLMFLSVVIITFLDKLFLNKAFLLALLTGVITLFLHFAGVEYYASILGVLSKTISMLFVVCAVAHYFKKHSVNYIKAVIITYYASLTFMVVASIISMYSNPGLSRQMAAMGEEDIASLGQFAYVLSYGTIHALPILIIPFLLLYKKNSKILYKLLFLSLTLLSGFCIYLADATTPLLIFIGLLIFMLVYNERRSVSYNIFIFLLLAILILPFLSKSFMAYFLSSIQPLFEGTSNYVKIDEFITLLNYGQLSGDLGSREDLYSTSLESFLQNPFSIKWEKGQVGNHMYIIDNIVVMGLFLSIPFISLLVYNFKLTYRYLKGCKKYFVIAFIVFIAMGCTKNFFLFLPTFLIIPFSLDLIYKDYKYDI